MKVSELEVGMLLKPAGDSEMFLKVNPYSGSNTKVPYITVRIRHHAASPYFGGTFPVVMYAGTRNDLKISKKEMEWSNRFVIVDDEICAVDPSAWRRMKML